MWKKTARRTRKKRRAKSRRGGERGGREKRKRDIFTAPIYKMAHDQLHSAILRGHGKNALYIGGTMRTRRTDAHRTLKYALIILPRRVLMPLTRSTCRTLLSSYPCSSSTYDPLRFPTLCRRSRIFHTAVLHAETRQKNAIPAPAVSCHPAIFLFSRNVRCQEPSAVPEIFPVPRAERGGGGEDCGVGCWRWWSRAR